MSLKTTSKANLATLRPDLSNYTDWQDMIMSYMRANDCWYAVDPEDVLEKQMKALRLTIPDDNKLELAKMQLKEMKANAEALTIIRQWIDPCHRPRRRRRTSWATRSMVKS